MRLVAGVSLALATTVAAGNAAVDGCLSGLETEPSDAKVVPLERCPALISVLFPDARPDWVSRPIAVAALRTTARSVGDSAPNPSLDLDGARVGEIVARTHVPAIPPWVQWFREWLERQEPEDGEGPAWARELVRWLEANGDWLYGVMQGVLALLVVILLAWILVGIRWPRWQWRQRVRRSEDSGAPVSSGQPRGFAAIGKLDDDVQVPALLAWLVDEWDRTERLPGARRMTDGEIARRLARSAGPATAGAFRELADTAQAALFGGRVPDSDSRQRCFQRARELAGGMR